MTTDDTCGDNRFEIIEKAKQDLLESTNISSSEDEMKVLERFLFRCWQMGWLDKYDGRLRYCIEYVNPVYPLLENGELNVRHIRMQDEHSAEMALTLILSFGAKICSLYRGNVIEGKLDEWPTPMIVEDKDWYSAEWLHEILDCGHF